MMKQIIQSYKTGEMTLSEVPCPQPQRGMVLVETRASVISAGTEKMMVDLAKKSLVGKARSRPDLVKKVITTAKREGYVSTLRKVMTRLDASIPLGYSCSGVVREIGEGVEGFYPGDVVACGGAGFANHSEFNIVPQNLCVKVPFHHADNGNSNVSFEESAFATIGAIALQGVRQASLTLGERVCVIGLGLLGQLTVQLCRACGCRVMGADLDPWKIQMAMGLGAEVAVHSKDLDRHIWQFTNGAGADAVIITASAKGSGLITLAGEISRLKGRVVAVGLVGLDVPRETYYKKELDLRLSMSYGPGRYDAEYEERGHDYPLPYVRWTEQRNMQAFLELVAARRLDVKPLISHCFPFEQAVKAYELITGGSEPSLGVVLEYGEKREEPKAPPLNAPVSLPGPCAALNVVGAGNFAKTVLLPGFKEHELVVFRGICTAKGISAKAAKDRFKFKYCAEKAEELIGDESANCVLVATRHNLHGSLVEKALAAGKHVFVEKPLCLDEDELDLITRRFAESVNGGGAPVLMVGFNRRFSPFIQRARSILANRNTPLVATYRVNAGFIPADSWVQDPVEGGGRIIGEVCHFVDTLRFLTGSPVRSVHAASIQTDDARLTSRDSLAITLSYRDGSVAVIVYHALGTLGFPKEKLEIAADGRVIDLNDFREMEVHGPGKERMKSKQDKGFAAEIDAFVKAVVKGGPAPIPLSEIVETTMVTFAVHKALNTGQVVYMDGEADRCR